MSEYAVTRIEKTGEQCQKCSQLVAQKRTVAQTPATYQLTLGEQRWPLCSNHAAAAVHTLALVHPTFRPQPADNSAQKASTK